MEDGQLWETQNTLTATVSGMTVNPGATPLHTKGAWVALFVATRNYSGFLLQAFGNTIGGGRWAVDLSWSATDTGVFVSNIQLQAPRVHQLGVTLHIPMAIPDGATVYARCQAAFASSTIQLAIAGMAGEGIGPFGKCQSLGSTVSGDTRGTRITVGLAPAEGGWTQLSTTNADTPTPTVEPVQAVIILCGNVGLAFTLLDRWFWDLTLGTPAVPPNFLLENIVQASTVATDQPLPVVIGPLPVQIPAATAIYARASSLAGGANFMDISILAFS